MIDLLDGPRGRADAIFFSEYGHVAYQINGIESHNNNMSANSCPDTHPWSSMWGQNVIFFFSESSYCILNKLEWSIYTPYK